MGSLHKNIQLILEFSRLHSWFYTFPTLHNDLPDDFICNISTYAGDTSHLSNCDQAFDLWQQLELASDLEFDLRDTGAGQEVTC